MRSLALVVSIVALAGGCADTETESPEPVTVDRLAETYVQLVLAVGQHDADYVDAYLGPAEWPAEAEQAASPLEAIRRRAEGAADALAELSGESTDELSSLRFQHLEASYASLIARVAMLEGEQLSFDQESKALYDAVAPSRPAEFYQRTLDRLDAALPGSGPVVERFDRYREAFIVPPDRVDGVLSAAIDACRERTRDYLELPEGESFTVEYVTDKSWSGYNWYQGSYQSLIQINIDLPIYVDRMLDLACHEGYPGHHVYNLIIERDLVEGRGWIEFAVYPLFSPRSLIAEGSANYGIEVAFPTTERIQFEREVLFPLAGLDPDSASTYYEIQELVVGLSFAGNEAARRYLDGEIDATAAADWLETYSLMTRPRAEQRVRFIDQYRSYVINYNLGQQMVREFIEARADDDADARWREFERLLSSPVLPSQLLGDG